MAKMTQDVRDVLGGQKMLPLATSDSSGKPNVAFITYWKILDDETILIVENFMNKTRKNLEKNPRAAVVAYRSEPKKSYQLKGTVRFETSGRMFEEAKAMAAAKKAPGKSAVIFRVEEIYDSSPGPKAGERIA
ncbi:MAG TPA: pyridoxamine 5'-phosphate oxidase [Candidatus Methanoperedenaceae archaeon]|nr:pyridoxamine 5'-phosphate oxidase [Candidatus Methanoperedenaceae archaeon]